MGAQTGFNTTMRNVTGIVVVVCMVLLAGCAQAGGARPEGAASQSAGSQSVAPPSAASPSAASNDVETDGAHSDGMPMPTVAASSGASAPEPAVEAAPKTTSERTADTPAETQSTSAAAPKSLPVPPPEDIYGDLMTLAPGQVLELAYAETTRGETTTKRYVLQREGDGYSLRIEKEDGESITLNADKEFVTVREAVRFAAADGGKGGHVTIVREGGPKGERVTFSDTLDGEIDKTETIGVAPWYGSTLLLARFVTSGRKNREFYLSEAEGSYFLRLEAIREKRETVTVNGEPVATFKVRVTMPDFRRVFWSSYYWFRASDGLLMRSEEVRGRPGTPTTHVVLDQVTLTPPAQPANGSD